MIPIILMMSHQSLIDNNHYHMFSRIMYGIASFYFILLLYTLNTCAAAVNRESLVMHKLLCQLMVKLNRYNYFNIHHNLKVQKYL